jgi:hypothetical protein
MFLTKNLFSLKHILVSFKYRNIIYLTMSASKSCVLLPRVSFNVMLLYFSHYSFPSCGWEVYRASIKLEILDGNKANEVKFLKIVIFSHFGHYWLYSYSWQTHELVFMEEMKSKYVKYLSE